MKIIYILFGIILLTGCIADTEQPENWEVNELFTQLSELRKEIKGLKKEVQNLKGKTAKKQKNGKKSIEIDLSNTFSLGNDDAKYAIVEYTDYQCPFCLKHSNKTLPIIKQQYVNSGVVKYYVKDFPLGLHHHAKNAAISTRCSGQQGKFWEMHELIFENNKQLSKTMFFSFASKLNIDVSLFEKCFNSPEVSKAVENDVFEAGLIGVQGTPAFFIGRIKDNKLIDVRALYGVQSFSSFSRIIKKFIQEE